MRWRPLVLVILFTACEPREPAVEGVDEVVRRVTAMAEWQKDASRCPAELIPAEQDLSYLTVNHCKSALGKCLQACEEGHAGSCYWLAYTLQSMKASDAASEALYQRSCKLGIVSGCTNRAAGMLHLKEPVPRVDQCAASTFSKACDLDDPWACTMFAHQLMQGIGVEKNDALALRVLEKSCKYGSDDPACIEAKQLEAELLKRLPRRDR
jgi:TPR repeat protein